jgi:hypothetical protein
MVKNVLILSILLFISFVSNGQIKVRNQPTNTGVIQIDINSSYFNDLIGEVAKQRTISHIKFFCSSNDKSVLGAMPYMDAEYIDVLEFENVDDEILNNILLRFRAIKKVQTIKIDKSKINALPIGYIYNMNPDNLIVKDCKALKPESLQAIIFKSATLRKICFNNCNLYSLTANLNSSSNTFIQTRGVSNKDNQKNNNLRVLDLRNNRLSEVGDYLSQFKYLDSIYLSGNFIPNQYADLMKFKNSNIRFIETDSIDENANKQIRSGLKKIDLVFTQQQAQIDSQAKTVFGKFSSNKTKYKVYSSAYIEYDRLFGNSLLTYNFDTASLDEVFWDTTDQFRRYTDDPPLWNSFRLFKERALIKKHITFVFFKKSSILSNNRNYTRNSFYKEHSEMNVYRKYKWIIEQPMTYREFRTLSKTNFIDLRVKYDGLNKHFTLYLKKTDGKIMQLNVMLAKGKNKNNVSFNSDKYADDYARYLSALSKKKKKHNRNIAKNKRKVQASVRRNKRNAWSVLRSYMSDVERSMTEEEWMEYYFNLVKYEEEALLSSYPEQVLLERKFTKMGFKKINTLLDTAETQMIFGYFTDQSNTNLPVKKIIIIDKSLLTYQVIKIESLINPIALLLPKSSNLNILIFLADQSVGMVSGTEIDDAFEKPTEVRLKASVVEPELITISQILKNFNL